MAKKKLYSLNGKGDPGKNTKSKKVFESAITFEKSNFSIDSTSNF